MGNANFRHLATTATSDAARLFWALQWNASLDNPYKPYQVEKALQLIADKGITRMARKRTSTKVFVVVASNGVDTYRTTHLGHCTCPAGLKSKHACYHVIAAQLSI